MNAIECGGIRYDGESIIQMFDGRPLKVVPKAEIKRIVWQYGYSSKHPYIQVIFGVVMIVIGLIPLRHLLTWFMVGGVALDLEFLILITAVLGFWCLLDARHRGDVLTVHGKEQYRMPFEKGTVRSDINEFLNAVQGTQGITIERAANNPA